MTETEIKQILLKRNEEDESIKHPRFTPEKANPSDIGRYIIISSTYGGIYMMLIQHIHINHLERRTEIKGVQYTLLRWDLSAIRIDTKARWDIGFAEDNIEYYIENNIDKLVENYNLVIGEEYDNKNTER